MSCTVTVTDEDVGKRVVDGTGTVVGSVAKTRNGVAYVDSDASLTATVVVALGGSYAREAPWYRVDPAAVERVTDREILVR